MKLQDNRKNNFGVSVDMLPFALHSTLFVGISNNRARGEVPSVYMTADCKPSLLYMKQAYVAVDYLTMLGRNGYMDDPTIPLPPMDMNMWVVRTTEWKQDDWGDYCVPEFKRLTDGMDKALSYYPDVVSKTEAVGDRTYWYDLVLFPKFNADDVIPIQVTLSWEKVL